VKVGSLVKYNYPNYIIGPLHHPTDKTGIVLYINKDGGTLKVLTNAGRVGWFITSYCEVISEGR